MVRRFGTFTEELQRARRSGELWQAVLGDTARKDPPLVRQEGKPVLTADGRPVCYGRPSGLDEELWRAYVGCIVHQCNEGKPEAEELRALLIEDWTFERALWAELAALGPQVLASQETARRALIAEWCQPVHVVIGGYEDAAEEQEDRHTIERYLRGW